MRLKELRAKGAFITAGPISKEIEWSHFDEAAQAVVTDKFTVHVRRHSFGTISRALANGEDRATAASLIAESILLGDKADEVLSPADAFNLDPGLATAFIKAINEVNGLAERVGAKNSPPLTNSGTT